MKIFIDTRAVAGQPTGIGQYVKRLVLALSKIDLQNNYYLLGGKIEGLPKNFTQKKLMGKRLGLYNRVWQKISFPKIESLFKTSFDIAHFTNYQILPNKSKKIVSTIYDISFIRYPEYGDNKMIDQIRKSAEYAVRHSDVILTISEFSKREIIDYYKISPDRVKPIYLAADDLYFSAVTGEEIEVARSKYKTGNKYILSIGTLEPRKNLTNLIKAFIKIRDENLNLVLVGKKDWQKELLEKEVLGLPDIMRDRIRFTGYLPDKDLKLILGGAQLFVFPSYYEGLGLPVVEAMAASVPVACSSASSLPEVGDGAVVYFDPKNIDEIKSTIEKILNEEDLRLNLIERGKEQAKRFSWDKTARQTLDIYNSLRT